MWGGVPGGATNVRSAPNSAQALATLEPAAAVLLSPNLVTPQQLKEAEAVFLDFRKISNPYRLCRDILEASFNEYILFETVGLLKISLVKEWSSIEAEDVQTLKGYLIHYVAHKPLPSSVREKILQVLSIIVKWQSLEDGGTSRHELVQNAKTLIGNGGEQSVLGCSLLSAILQEHTSSARPSDNLSSDKRHQIRRQFECTDLFDISSFGIQTLQDIVEKGALNNHGDIMFAEKLLQLVRTALCWGQSTLMLPALLFDSDRKEQSEAWTALITNDKFFITLGVLGRQGEPLLSPVLACLEQLTYAIAGCSEKDKENALRLAKALFPLLGVAPSPAPATALRRLVVNYSRHLLSLPPDEFLQFLTTLHAYIEHLIRLSALEEANTANGLDEEGGWQMGLVAALEAWVELLHVCAPQLSTIRPPKPIPPPFIEGSAHIFDTLLKTRLAPPDGTRYAGFENEAEIEEEGNDIQKYDSLLSLAGALGQAAPEHSIPLLCRLLEARTIRMQELFMTGIESPELCCIYEDLHWTILFAAHILTQDGEGEIPAIPGKLVHHSIRVPGDLEASVRLLASPESHPSNDDLQIANSTIRLIAGVWRMCWIAGWGMGRWVASPTLGASVTWFLRRWARAYWLSGDSCAVVSGKPGPVLNAVWGRQSPRDIWATQRLSSGALALLRSLPGDPEPTHRAIALLRTVALINCQEGSNEMVHVWEAVKWGIGSDGISLSEETRRGLAAAASAAISSVPEEQQLSLLNDLLSPINSALMTVSSSSAYLQALDIYTGLAEGCQPKSAISIWKILEPAVSASVQGLHYGGAVTRNTLHLAAACVGHLSQSTLNLSDGLLLSHIINMLRAYSSKHVLQFNNAAHAADAEDDYCEETMLVMEIVSELVAKGYDTTESGSKYGMAAILEGIRVILPRMMPPTPLLQRPNVAKRYYRLLFDFGPDIICPLEDQFFNAIMRSIANGLEAPSDEDATLMCKLLGNLGRRANSTINGSSRLLDTLPTLANSLLSSAATGALQAHIEFAASTYYNLACSLKTIQLPPELASLMKSNIPTPQLKTSFTKYFSHLQTLHSI